MFANVQLVLTPKTKQHPENCMITAIKHEYENYCVEIYNVFGDFHILKPIQLEIEEGSHWHKYKNKRHIMTEEEMLNTYTVINVIEKEN